MAINVNDVVVGGIYKTSNNQERRITSIANGRVHYESRGGNVKNQWSPGHTKSNPPSIQNFADACEEVVSKP